MSKAAAGHEIRRDVLHMAIGILSENRQIDMANNQLLPEPERTAVEGYTIEEVVEEAEKLFEFVDRQNR